MDTATILKRLKNLRKKWRTEQTRERKFQSGERLGYVPGALSLEKSVGIDIGYGMCSSELDRFIRELERATTPG